MTKSNLGRKGFISAHTSRSQSFTKAKPEQELKQERRQKPQRKLWLLGRSLSYTVQAHLGWYYPERAGNSPHIWEIITGYQEHVHGASWKRLFFSWGPLFVGVSIWQQRLASPFIFDWISRDCSRGTKLLKHLQGCLHSRAHTHTLKNDQK